MARIRSHANRKSNSKSYKKFKIFNFLKYSYLKELKTNKNQINSKIIIEI